MSTRMQTWIVQVHDPLDDWTKIYPHVRAVSEDHAKREGLALYRGVLALPKQAEDDELVVTATLIPNDDN